MQDQSVPAATAAAATAATATGAVSMSEYVQIRYMDPPPFPLVDDRNNGKKQTKLVSCCIFIYPQRESGVMHDMVEDPAYAKRLASYLHGLRRVLEITRDHLPGCHVRLYVDDSVPQKSTATMAELDGLRRDFPHHLERAHVKAAGVLADLRDHAAPGNTTFLPSVWRFLSLFDEERPADVVHLSDLDSAPFIPFSPAGREWEARGAQRMITAYTRACMPAHCALGRALTQHDVNGCTTAGVSSFQRKVARRKNNNSNNTLKSLLPVEAWHRMMLMIVDTHFRAFLEQAHDDDARVLREIAASPEYTRVVRSVLSGERSCEDEDLLAPLVSRFPSAFPDAAVAPGALRKSLQYVRLVMLPLCEGTRGVPANLRVAFRDSRVLNDPGIILRFEYGLDEVVMHGLLEFLGAADVYVIDDHQGGMLLLSRAMQKHRTVDFVTRVASGVTSFVKTLPLNRVLNASHIQTMFAEQWLRIMVFSKKDAVAAARMTDAHYTLFAAALSRLRVGRADFRLMTQKLADQDAFAVAAAKRLFEDLAKQEKHEKREKREKQDDLQRVPWVHAWNVLFGRYAVNMILGWVHYPDLDPSLSVGLEPLPSIG